MNHTSGYASALPDFPEQPPLVLLPLAARAGREHPSGYLPDPGLQAAIKVSLVLRKPLLVTGEPGTGKTQLASYLSWHLGHRDASGRPGQPLMFEAKSGTTARDLFYTYNSLGRFHAAQTGEGSRRSVDYITYNAFGAAILDANPRAAVEAWLPEDFHHDGPRQSVVLIDEVDKAPRDFPNDILNEVENMYFKVPELGTARISAPAEMQPVLVITSNSEKNLPGPFLRRCVYYHIPFPNEERLEKIVSTRITELARGQGPFLREAISLLGKLRESTSALQKKPATAELLDWLLYLVSSGADTGQPLRKQGDLVLSSTCALVKSESDQQNAEALLKEWLRE